MNEDLFSILQANGNNPSWRGQWIFLNCVFHPEEEASLAIFKDYFKCFGCGKVGSIDYLLEELGIKERPKLDIVQNIKESLITTILSQLSSLEGLPSDATTFNAEFRNITKETFAHFQVFTSDYYPDELVFPIFEGRELRGLIRKPLTGKYLANFFQGYYPFNFNNCCANGLIVVEGVFDALSVWQAGFTNVCAILGTGNVFPFVKYLRQLKAKNVQILFDGDTAGYTAAKKLNGMYPNSSIIEMPQDTDPNSLNNIEEFLKRNIRL